MKSNLGTITIVAVLVAILGIGGYLMFGQTHYDEDFNLDSDQVAKPEETATNQTPQPAPVATTANDSEVTFGDNPAPAPTPTPAPKPKSQGAAAAITEQEEVTVTYTDSGFSPRSITISAGTKVKFENMSNQSMQVASAPYPTHSAYPGFDLRAVGKGGFVFFTFPSKGAFNYQNDRDIQKTGTIIVN